jgi:hypothetical protein
MAFGVGAALGAWPIARERRQRHGGHLLRQLRERLRARSGLV